MAARIQRGQETMAEREQTETTAILRRARAGEKAARDELFTRLFQHLEHIAAARLHERPPDQTLQPTALVNEAYIRLIDKEDFGWKDRKHSLCIAGNAIRQVLVDHAYMRQAKKRSGDRVRVSFNEGLSYAQVRMSAFEETRIVLTLRECMDTTRKRFFRRERRNDGGPQGNRGRSGGCESLPARRGFQ